MTAPLIVSDAASLRALIREEVERATAAVVNSAARESEAPRMLAPAQLAERLGIGTRELRRRVKAGTVPAPVLVGPRTPRWSSVVIAAWEEGRALPPPITMGIRPRCNPAAIGKLVKE